MPWGKMEIEAAEKMRCQCGRNRKEHWPSKACVPEEQAWVGGMSETQRLGLLSAYQSIFHLVHKTRECKLRTEWFDQLNNACWRTLINLCSLKKALQGHVTKLKLELKWSHLWGIDKWVIRIINPNHPDMLGGWTKSNKVLPPRCYGLISDVVST